MTFEVIHYVIERLSLNDVYLQNVLIHIIQRRVFSAYTTLLKELVLKM